MNRIRPSNSKYEDQIGFRLNNNCDYDGKSGRQFKSDFDYNEISIKIQTFSIKIGPFFIKNQTIFD